MLAMHDLVQAEDAPDASTSEPARWLEARGVVGRDGRSMAALGGHRLTIYRRLVRRGLAGAIRVQVPRTAARLGDRFDQELDAYFGERCPDSHYLRDVAFEFVAWAAPRWQGAADVPAYLVDLARHELSAFAVAGAPREVTKAVADLDLNAPIAFDPVARIGRYDHAIHRLSARLDATDTPELCTTVLLVYRDDEQDVRYLELSPLADIVITRLMSGEALGPAVIHATAATGQPLTQAVLEGMAKLLADLAERGIVLGRADEQPADKLGDVQ